MQLEKFSGLEIGRLVNSRELRPKEVISYFINRIKERNPSLNAFVYLKEEDAFAEAQLLEDKIMRGEYGGPFAGVPVGLKDFLPSKKGWTHSHGGVKSIIRIDEADSMFYIAARSAGAIAVGKTNSPHFGFSGTCDNKLYGCTSNPFHLITIREGLREERQQQWRMVLSPLVKAVMRVVPYVFLRHGVIVLASKHLWVLFPDIVDLMGGHQLIHIVSMEQLPAPWQTAQ